MKQILLITLLSISIFTTASAKSFTENWTVSSYGFLVFPTPQDLEEFRALAQTKTHAQMQTYLGTIHFTSLGSTLYSNNSDNPVSAEESIDYALTPARIIQVSGVVIKPVSPRSCDAEFTFILAMTPANLTTSSFEDLEDGIFDDHTMNRFALDPITEQDPLDVIMGQTDAGIDESSVSCASSARRPFWGWGPWICGPCENGFQNCHRNYYVFWILVDVEYDPANPCYE